MPKTSPDKSLLRHLPKVDSVLGHSPVSDLACRVPEMTLKKAVRDEIDARRYDGVGTTQLTDTLYSSLYHDISGSNVVWQRYSEGDNEIFLYDGSSTTQVGASHAQPIASPSGSYEALPSTVTGEPHSPSWSKPASGWCRQACPQP